MVRPKLLTFSIWAFLLVTMQGMEIQLTPASTSKWKKFFDVLAESIDQSDESLSKLQQWQKMKFQKCCCCRHKVVDAMEYDEENLENLLHDQRERETQERMPLTAEQKEKLTTAMDDTKKNENSDYNTRCLSCMDLFEKQFLNRFIHKDGSTPFHHSTCYACERDYHDMYGDNCAFCRKPSDRAICTYLDDFYAIQPKQPRIFDGSSLAFFISSSAMTVLSIYITANNPMEGVWNIYIPGGGEGGEYGENGAFLKVLSAFGVQQLARNIWGFYFLVSTYFLYVTRNSTSLLMDVRGITYLVLPMITALMTTANQLDGASVMTIIPLSLFVSDLYLKGDIIASARFSKFTERFPQIQFMQTHIMKPRKGIDKFAYSFATNFLVWDFMGAIATAFNSAVWAQHGILISSIVNNMIYWDTYIETFSLFPQTTSGQSWASALSYINVFFVAGLLADKMIGDFKKSRPTFNFKELGLFLCAGFAMQHSDLIQEGFLFINFAGMALLTIKLMHYIFNCKCCNGPTPQNNQ